MAKKLCVSAFGPGSYAGATEGNKENIRLAIAHLDHWMDKVLPDCPDLIVMPECCDCPGGMGGAVLRDFAMERGLTVLEHCQTIARREGVNLVYSSILPATDGTLRNALVFIGRNGEVRGAYHKNHLTLGEHADIGVKFGKDAPVISMDFGRVAGVICFDLNFDELREKYVQSRPALLVFSSLYHGGVVQRFWAQSCRSYFVGAVGGLPCSVIDPLGDVLAASTNYFPMVTHRINLDYELAHLDFNWDKLTALKKKYGVGVTIKDPGLLGYVLITSEIDGISTAEMVDEFAIERLEAYMTRSRRYRHTAGNMEE